MLIRDAEAADSAIIAKLGGLALRAPVDPEAGLPAKVQKLGGRIPLKYGEGVCRVAETASGEAVGMVYSAPPIDWLELYPAHARRMLAGVFTKVELLAVAEEYRMLGVGSALLKDVETAEQKRGIALLYSDVAMRDISLRRWYKKRGYTFAAPGEPILLTSKTAGLLSLVDGSDGYLLTAKTLRPGSRIERTQVDSDTWLFVTTENQ